MNTITRTFLGAVAAASISTVAAGCGQQFKVSDPPDGFVEVNNYGSLARYKALDNVGLNVRAFDNYEGGTIEYWSGDLLKKLAERGYTKTGEDTINSGNGVKGNRYDFSYVPLGGKKKVEGEDDPDAMPEKFYTACLFVTKDNIVVIELAGNMSLAAEYRGRLDAIAANVKVR
jgi:hypothetical protein